MKSNAIGQCVLWAAAIVGAAISGAPATFTLVVLPALAVVAWLGTLRSARARCLERRAGA